MRSVQWIENTNRREQIHFYKIIPNFPEIPFFLKIIIISNINKLNFYKIITIIFKKILEKIGISHFYKKKKFDKKIKRKILKISIFL